MGTKSILLRELKGLETDGANDRALGAWLRLNITEIAEALHVSDDMVAIAQIDLKDMAAWENKKRV